ncbi:hypothetical protein QGN23_04165 [Chryseobacterium gotjawalense]|uniref:DoxX n=2 Tax=Chryseobacterium TaxID=59732 RepID=A0A4P6ZI07_9FLAO|nr:MULTISPECIES: hypothetical protein [Chryseobacterium]MDQ0477248.1 putative membrane protein [Chryseobacterium sp. MDT2-18]QBO59319.1 hypothetical protein NBC122_02515 [Chryseobacterium salivictor]WHF52481.1 hypothetical protein QGN23_04165 [Chryseobacterium sp. wdc7]
MRVIFWVIASILLAFLMMAAGVQHLWNPGFYLPFVPSFLPFPLAIVYLSGIVELLLGIVTLFLNQKYTQYGLFGIFVLMVIFLPLHIADAFKAQPVIGSPELAYFRLVIQLILIWLSWRSYKFTSLVK